MTDNQQLNGFMENKNKNIRFFYDFSVVIL